MPPTMTQRIGGEFRPVGQSAVPIGAACLTVSKGRSFPAGEPHFERWPTARALGLGCIRSRGQLRTATEDEAECRRGSNTRDYGPPQRPPNLSRRETSTWVRDRRICTIVACREYKVAINQTGGDPRDLSDRCP
jgi:hypothetical protein